MKKISKKVDVVKIAMLGLVLLGIILTIPGAFIKTANVSLTFKVIGLLLLVAGLFVLALRSEKNNTLKMILVFMLSALIITWILPFGYFQNADFYEYGMQRIGIGDLGVALFYALNYSMDKIVFLAIVGGFYGVLAINSGYKAFVNSIANLMKKNVIVSSVIISLIITLLVSFLSQTFIVLAFIPLFISILVSMKMDKLSTFAITFGSALVGVLGAIYGTNSLAGYIQYSSTNLTDGILYRVIILVVSFVLYNVLLILRLKRVSKNKKEEVAEDLFIVEDTKKAKSSLLFTIMFVIFALFIIVAYVAWETNWKVTIFNDFYKWLTELKLGNDFTIFGYLLGKNSAAFGKFDLLASTAVLLVMSIVVSLLYGVKFNEYLDGFINGIKKMIFPIILLVCVYIVFVFCYMSPFMPTITNLLLSITKTFNPYLTALTALISSIFHTDLGYTAYTVGSFLTTSYADKMPIVNTIFISMYGIVQLIFPTSVLLLVGLSMMNLDYKKWFKYVWVFVVGLLIVLLVLFTVITYI